MVWNTNLFPGCLASSKLALVRTPLSELLTITKPKNLLIDSGVSLLLAASRLEEFRGGKDVDYLGRCQVRI